MGGTRPSILSISVQRARCWLCFGRYKFIYTFGVAVCCYLPPFLGKSSLQAPASPSCPLLTSMGCKCKMSRSCNVLSPLKLPECSAKGRSSQSSSYIGAR